MKTAIILSSDEVLDIVLKKFDISNEEVATAIQERLKMVRAEVRYSGFGGPIHAIVIELGAPIPVPPPLPPPFNPK